MYEPLGGLSKVFKIIIMYILTTFKSLYLNIFKKICFKIMKINGFLMIA